MTVQHSLIAVQAEGSTVYADSCEPAVANFEFQFLAKAPGDVTCGVAADMNWSPMTESDQPLEAIFTLVFGPSLGQIMADFSRLQPNERVIVLRPHGKYPLAPALPEPPDDAVAEGSIADPLPSIDLFDWVGTHQFLERVGTGWDVLVGMPPWIEDSRSLEVGSFLAALSRSGRSGARAVLVLPVSVLGRSMSLVRAALMDQGAIEAISFPSAPSPRSLGLSPSLRLAVMLWRPGPASGRPTQITSLLPSGVVDRRFGVVLDAAMPWTVAGLDPERLARLKRWAASLNARPLSEVADVVRPTLRASEGQVVLHPRQITADGIDLTIEAPDQSANLHVRHVELRPGDIVGRALDRSNWCVVDRAQLVEPLFAGQQVVVIRPTQIDAAVLLAFLRSDAAEEQLATQDSGGSLRQIRTATLERLLVPTGIAGARNTSGDPVRSFRKAAVALADGLEARSRSAFDSADPAVIRELLVDTATEASMALDLLGRTTDPLYRARQFFPHPLARSIRTYENDLAGGTPQDVYFDLLRFGETAITVVGILGLAYQANVLGAPLPEEWRNGVMRRGVSLGLWLDAANRGAEAARRNGEALAGLATALSTKSQLNSALNVFLVKRNEQAHGAGPRTPYEYGVQVGELEEALMTAVQELIPLARSEWFVVTGLRWPDANGSFTVLGRSLTGDHPDFTKWEGERRGPLAHDVIHVSLGALDLPLRGFCRLHSCERCLNEELYYPDRVDGSVRLRSLDRGHQLTVAFDDSGLPSDLLSGASGG